MKVYLDNAATTPVDAAVAKIMRPFFSRFFGNPSSIHQFGQKALAAIDRGRQQVADFLQTAAEEIIFTGGATEANNLALVGVVRTSRIKIPHIITSQIEHSSVLKTCRELEKQDVRITYLRPNKDGLINPDDVLTALTQNTILVSIVYANNEIGTIQPIKEIGKLLAKQPRKIVLHTDAVQAANYLDCDVRKLRVDLLTLSAHKIYGPKGVGCLYVKKGTTLTPLIFGGGQENGWRSGTENVPGIIGLGAAVSHLNHSKNAEITAWRNRLIEGIQKTIPRAILNGSGTERLPNNVNFSFPGAEGESIVMSLDQAGIAAATGSACSSHNLQPSATLLAIGRTPRLAHSSVRFTLSKYTTKQEVDYVLKILPVIVAKLRKISGL